MVQDAEAHDARGQGGEGISDHAQLNGFKVTFNPAKAFGGKVPEKAGTLVDVLLPRLLAVPPRADTKTALVDAVNKVEPGERETRVPVDPDDTQMPARLGDAKTVLGGEFKPLPCVA